MAKRNTSVVVGPFWGAVVQYRIQQVFFNLPGFGGAVKRLAS